MLTTLQTFKKPADFSFLIEKARTHQGEVEKVKQTDRKSPMNNMASLQESLQIYYWAMNPNPGALKDFLDEALGQTLFWANKTRKKGSEADVAWIDALIAVMEAIKAFLMERLGDILTWRGKQDAAGAAAFFAQQAGGASAPTATATPAAPAKAAEEVKKAPAAAAKKPAGPKPPVKELKNGNKWMVENIAKDTLKFEGDEEVNRRIAFNLFACTDSVIEIVGKCQNISIVSCKKVTVIFDSVVSQVELLNCTAVEVKARVQLPMMSLEGCKQTKIHLTNKTKGSKIGTCCCRSTFVNFPNEGVADEDAFDPVNQTRVPVPETFDTVVSGNTLETVGVLEAD